MRNSIWLLVFLSAVLGPALSGCSERRPDAVFLIVVDTLRPDRLSCYGRDLYRTPHVDSLSSEGVRFTDAHSVASWTIPSMGAMMTSLYPTELGLVEKPAPDTTTFAWRERRTQISYALDRENVTLAEVMRRAGFRTAAFVDQPGLNATGSFVQGFDDYFYPEDTETIARYDTASPPEYESRLPFLREARAVDARLVGKLDDWLSSHRRERVFVWLHLLTPHSPYLPPPWTRRRSSATRKAFEPTNQSDDYDGEVIAADELLGDIVATIRARIGTDRAAIIFTSDHGEAFGEHGMWQHGHTLHGEVLRVPLVIRAPGVPAGVTVESTVRTIDIFPTVLDLAGVDPPGPTAIRGESLVPLFGGPGPRRAVYSEGMLFGNTERSLMVDGKKLIVGAKRGEAHLYNADYDAGEEEAVEAAYPALTDSLRLAIRTLHDELVANFERRSRTHRVTAAEAVRIEDTMRALGYIDE